MTTLKYLGASTPVVQSIHELEVDAPNSRSYSMINMHHVDIYGEVVWLTT